LNNSRYLQLVARHTSILRVDKRQKWVQEWVQELVQGWVQQWEKELVQEWEQVWAQSYTIWHPYLPIRSGTPNFRASPTLNSSHHLRPAARHTSILQVDKRQE
jgi:hypothetical protein